MPQEPRQATAATQPYPQGEAFVPQALDMPLYGYPLLNKGRIFTPFWREPVALKPSSFGGTTWAPSSFDPRSQTLFICGIDLAGVFKGGGEDAHQRGRLFLGGEFIFARARSGIFAAMDLTTNRLRWQQRWEDMCYSGSTATGGDLVFTGQNDGRFVALDARNGNALWEFQTGAGVNAPPVVFEHKGAQYVGVYAAGSLFAKSAPGDSLWLFALHGLLDPVAPSSPPAPVPLHFTEGNASAGIGVFARYCAPCHGTDGAGGHGGGPALTRALPRAQVVTIVAGGRGTMPALSTTLTAEQISDVAAFVAGGLRAN